MRMVPYRFIFLNGWFPIGGTILEIRRYDLLGGGKAQGLCFAVSKAYTRPMLLAIMVMNLHSETVVKS